MILKDARDYLMWVNPKSVQTISVNCEEKDKTIIQLRDGTLCHSKDSVLDIVLKMEKAK